MSTRGAFGFTIDGIDKIQYNHFDSYPGGLGIDILKALRQSDLESLAGALSEGTHSALRAAARRVKIGTTAEDERLMRDAIREIPPLDAILKYELVDNSLDFLSDSLFCEWAWVVNFDTNKFEAYKGFQEKPHTNGRFSANVKGVDHRTTAYYPVALVAEWPLNALPSDADFFKACERVQ